MKIPKYDKVNIICNENQIGEELYNALIGVINASNIDSKHTIRTIEINKITKSITIKYSGYNNPSLKLPYGTILRKKRLYPSK